MGIQGIWIARIDACCFNSLFSANQTLFRPHFCILSEQAPALKTMGNANSWATEPVAESADHAPPSSEPSSLAPSSACDTLLAKLDELMDFLGFAKLPTAAFHGVVRGLL